MGQLELVQPLPLEPHDITHPRADHGAIAAFVRDGAKVLDVGAGDGALIALLQAKNGARVRGLELDPMNVHACVRRGFSVVQGDAERDLDDIPSGAFDYVVLSHTLQRVRRPAHVLKNAARIGERVIATVSNTAHWRARGRLLWRGRAGSWDGESVRPTSIRDFVDFARSLRLTVERATPLSRGNAGAPFAKVLWRANLFAEEAVFLLAP